MMMRMVIQHLSELHLSFAFAGLSHCLSEHIVLERRASSDACHGESTLLAQVGLTADKVVTDMLW